MTVHQFIFSNESTHRRGRHFAFWGLYCLITYYAEFDVEDIRQLQSTHIYLWNLQFFALFLPMNVFLVYFILYVLAPRFIETKRYFSYMLATAATMLFCFTVDLIPGYILHLNYPYPTATEAGKHFVFFMIDYNRSIHQGICLVACVTCITLGKSWYRQQLEITQLTKQDAENRSRLFKSQMQPEFLFQSLDNLYQKIQNDPERAPALVLRLSDIFSYILYETEEEFVMLEKELMVAENFIAANQMRVNDATKVSLHITGSPHNKYIAPLTLFSFLVKRISSSPEGSFAEIVIDIKEAVLSLDIVLRYKVVLARNDCKPADLWQAWYDPVPAFSNYFTSEGPEDSITIRAILPLVRTIDLGDLHQPLIFVN